MSILWNPGEATVVEKVSLPVITTGAQNMGDGIYWLKAGTPLDEDLAVANNGDAMYIVAEDFFFVSTNPSQERMVPLIKAGYVDLNKAEAASGLTYTDAAVAALKEAGIEVVDGLLETGGGSGGGGLPSGGTTGQVLKKKSNTDYDAEWGDESGGGDAASILQVSVYEDGGTWKVDSSGTTFSDVDEPFFYFDHPFDIYLTDAPLEGYATTVRNIYRLTKMWFTTSPDETYGHLLFSAVINDSGTIKLKTYQVDAVIQTGWSDATVTVTSTNV